MRIGNKRSSKRLTVNEIVKTLTEMSDNLSMHDGEKVGHISRLESEKADIEGQIIAAQVEKDRGEKIAANIRQLLDV